MDIISQLQEQIDTVASLAFNSIGTLQRDAPPVRLSSNYPEPPPAPVNPTEDIAEQPKQMSAALVKAAKQFDALVAALPLSEGGEEAQLKRIAELQAENDAVGQELQKQLEAAGKITLLAVVCRERAETGCRAIWSSNRQLLEPEKTRLSKHFASRK
ncbi:Mediator of RNA polymerase II transcription subunit 21 [Linum perenne]